MQKERLNISRGKARRLTQKGFSLVEALLSIALFALLVTTFVSSLIYGQESERLAGDRARANFLAEEGLEVARNMRDADFANLTAGTHGLAITGNEWVFSGALDISDIFTRSIIVTDMDAHMKTITASVSWKQNEQRDGTVSLTTHLANWKTVNPTSSEQFFVNTSVAQTQSGPNPKIYDVTMKNNGIEDVVISSTNISWSGISSGAKLQAINMDGNSVWTGSDVSGATQDISDFTLALNGNTYPLEFIFDKAINGISVIVVFTMSDESTKQVIFTPGVPPDTIAPANITNLATSGATISSINLSWTAPGDDGTSGTATNYDIRYLTENITDSNWSSATQVSGEPTPASAGSNETMTVSGLSSATTYYFAIKTSDEVPNVSELSNVSSGATLELNQAGYLIVNTVGATRSGNTVTGITLQNAGSSNITITTMTVSWTGINNNRRLNSISIGGSSLWTGSNSTGVIENIADKTLATGSATQVQILSYSNTIPNIIVSITYVMSDGSTKTVSGIGPL